MAEGKGSSPLARKGPFWNSLKTWDPIANSTNTWHPEGWGGGGTDTLRQSWDGLTTNPLECQAVVHMPLKNLG